MAEQVHRDLFESLANDLPAMEAAYQAMLRKDDLPDGDLKAALQGARTAFGAMHLRLLNKKRVPVDQSGVFLMPGLDDTDSGAIPVVGQEVA